jgi:hypothetical protein
MTEGDWLGDWFVVVLSQAATFASNALAIARRLPRYLASISGGADTLKHGRDFFDRNVSTMKGV